MSKFNFQRYNKVLDDLSCESFYILNRNLFNQEYFNLLNAFKQKYSQTNIAYSFKTNYVSDLVNEVRKNNGYAEVVSSMELELALRTGFDEKSIFFNGPFKHQNIRESFLSKGGIVNIDSYSEFISIKNFAESKNIKVRIGIRLNFGSEDFKSRFGVDVNSGEIDEILKLSKKSLFISIASIHCHYAPRNIDKWEFCTRNMISFLKSKYIKYFDSLDYISLGGGMYSDMSAELKSQIKFKIPSFEEYAMMSSNIINDFFLNEKPFINSPELLVEPGTALASKSLDFLVKVVSIKKINESFIVNTTGSKYNVNPSIYRLNSPYDIFNKKNHSNTELKNALIAGYTCIESDIIHNEFSGFLSQDDLIVFKEVGSYSLVMKPQFILPNIPIIEFLANGEYKIIKRAETFDDVFSAYMSL